MGHRYMFLLVAMVLLTQTGASKNETYKHPGTVTDAVTGDGIEADADAFATKEPAGGGDDCPEYKESLDRTKSEVGTGSFAFRIDKEKAGYVAVYCDPGYISRIEGENDNSRNGSPVQPHPVSLFPKQAKLASDNIDAVQASYVAIARVLDRAQSDLRYLSSSRQNEGPFFKALQQFPEDDRRVVAMLRDRKITGVLVTPLRSFMKSEAAPKP